MPPDAGANDAPSEGTTAPVSGSPASGDPAMEVNEWAVGLPPVQSPGMMMTFSPAMTRLEWKRIWPTSPSHPPVDKLGRGSLTHGGTSSSGGCIIVGPMTAPEWPPEKELCRQSPQQRNQMSRRWGANHQWRPWSDPLSRPQNCIHL